MERDTLTLMFPCPEHDLHTQKAEVFGIEMPNGARILISPDPKSGGILVEVPEGDIQLAPAEATDKAFVAAVLTVETPVDLVEIDFSKLPN